MYRSILTIILTLFSFYYYLFSIKGNIKIDKRKNIYLLAYFLIIYNVMYYASIVFLGGISTKQISFNIILCSLFFIIIIAKSTIYSFMPRKSKEIYECVFMHRGFHVGVAENSLEAYKLVTGKFGIEMDIRYLKKSNKIICFHDRYTSRLLGVPGKISNFSFNDLRRYRLKGSKSRVTSLNKALDVINGKSALLIEVKGLLTQKYFNELKRLLNKYNGKYYFHCKNIITYFKLNKYFPNKVFWILNIFRKRFSFVKGKHYNGIFGMIKGLVQDASIEIPTLEDISQILVKAIEGSDSVQEVCTTISQVMNNYTSRTNSDHWLMKSLKLHRGIISNKYPENSTESIEACIKFAKYTNTYISIELDLIYKDNKILCYHSDKISQKLGQDNSCAQKVDIENSISLEEIIDIAKNSNAEELVSFIFDIKDFHMSNRVLEREFIRIIEETNFNMNFSVQSWNPLVLMYFEKNRPEYIRGQVGHSLSGLIKYVPLNGIPWVVNVLLFNLSHADYCVYDASPFIYVLIKYNKLKGRPVLIYAPKSEIEIEGFIGKEQIEGFFVENVLDSKSWSKRYIRQFKKHD